MKNVFLLSLCILTLVSCEQNAVERTASALYNNTVPLITVEELVTEVGRADSDFRLGADSTLYVVDTRELEEYQVSHIQGAFPKPFMPPQDAFDDLDRDVKIIVYCSIGVRSEEYGEQLLEMGFTNVYNLHGGIFSWVNRGHEVFDMSGEPTRKVHGYNPVFGNLLKDREVVYEGEPLYLQEMSSQ